MEFEKIIADIDSLLKMGVGDPYRLKHIRQSYLQGKSLYKTDDDYWKHMREKYIEKRNIVQSDKSENHIKDENAIHCWKCGKKGSRASNFCTSCGSSLFKIDDNSNQINEPISTIPSKKHSEGKTRTSAKILIGIGIFLLSNIIIAYSFPIASPGLILTIPEASNLCNTNVGQLGQTGQQMFAAGALETCEVINQANRAIHLMGLIGIITLIVGLITRKQ